MAEAIEATISAVLELHACGHGFQAICQLQAYCRSAGARGADPTHPPFASENRASIDEIVVRS